MSRAKRSRCLVRRPAQPVVMPQPITERFGENPVLCAVDASEHGWEVPRGAALAVRVGAPLEPLHVARNTGGRGAVDRLSTDDAACVDSQESLELLERYAAVSPVATSYSVLKGIAAEEILLAVSDIRPPVLVLGSHGRSTLRDLIGRRTSRSVMSRTSVATLVVSPGAEAVALDRCGPVVCGVDETAALASAAATDLVLMAVPSPQMSTSPAPLSGVASVGQAPLTVERERRLLRDLAEGIAQCHRRRAGCLSPRHRRHHRLVHRGRAARVGRAVALRLRIARSPRHSECARCLGG